MRPSVNSNIIGQHRCIGCGLCAALCPHEALAIRWNQYGEYVPLKVSNCTTECGLCLKVCPLSGEGENEDAIGERLYGGVHGIQHRIETGYHLASYVGYAERYRPTSASGGMSTWLLEALLADGVIDHVICVAPTGDPEKLFSYKVFTTPEDVRSGAGSAYYPVEMSAVIKQVLDAPGRYAITGLPCFIKAVRLAQQRNIKLKERIIVTVGLVCGQLKSRSFTDYVANLAGVQGRVTEVCYRGKSRDHPVSNFYYTFTTEDGEERRILWRDGIDEAWRNRWFTPDACNYCDDVFAECADVTCMDAWLAEYSTDSQGTNLVLVRSPLLRDVIECGKGKILDPISIEQIVQSQSGILAIKRQHLAYRLHLDKHLGQEVSSKRVMPARPKNYFLRQEVILKERMRVASRNLCGNGLIDKKHMQKEMRPYLRRLTVERRLSRAFTLPKSAIRFFQKNKPRQ